MFRSFVLLLALVVIGAGCGTIEKPTVTPPEMMLGNPERGAQIFKSGLDAAPPCSTCHKTVKGSFGFSVGPNLAGIHERAATRVTDLTAEEYLRESILNPHSFVVAGYRDSMYPNFSLHFNDQDIADLVAYLMTL